MGSTTTLLFVLVTLATAAVISVYSQVSYGYQSGLVNDVSKPSKSTGTGKKMYYHKNLYKSAPPMPFHRQAMFWGQRWQRQPVSLPVVPRNVQQLSARPTVPQIPLYYRPVNRGPVVAAAAVEPAASVVAPSRAQEQAIDWSAADMMQRPIDDPVPRRSNRGLGDMCSYSRDCSSRCCLLDRSSRSRSCQPMANFAERCSLAQVKGDLYADACPCSSGVDYCSSSAAICAA